MRTKCLTKIYNKVKVVNSADIVIKRGGIYGLIGKNGAGKTTLIRMIAGLIPQSAGEIFLFETSNIKTMSEYRKKMSFIVETPYFQPNMTAFENLNLQRIQKGISDKSCIDFALKKVKLDGTGKKKARDFSLGMRQRLGLAISVLSNPEFMVLDEPVNGLDPEGIVEMRKLLIELNRTYGITILISSHLLSELSLMVTDYIFIDEGCVKEQISNEDLNHKCAGYLYLELSDVEKAANLLHEKLKIQLFQVEGNSLMIHDTISDVSSIVKILVKADIMVYHVEQKKTNLEQYFLSNIGGKI